jgi:hypothetical protein
MIISRAAASVTVQSSFAGVLTRNRGSAVSNKSKGRSSNRGDSDQHVKAKVRSQGSGVRSQKSEVRSQMSGVRSQESESDNPPVGVD